MKKGFDFFVGVLICLLMVSCGYYRQGSKVGTETLEMDIGRLEFKVLPPVERLDPFVYFSKLPSNLGGFSAVIYRFRVNCSVQNRKVVEEEFSRVLFSVWLKQKVFKRLVYVCDGCLSEKGYGDFDLFVCPEVNYLYLSGAQGRSVVSLSVKIYNKKKELLWFVEHAGAIEYKTYRDYILFDVKSRMPASPGFAIMYVLSRDLGNLLKGNKIFCED